MSVLVFVENWEGKFKKLSFELVSYGNKLAEMLQTRTVAVSIGSVGREELGRLSSYGADKILNINRDDLKILDSQAYALVLHEVAKAENAVAVVISNNNTGKAVAPRLAVRLKAGLGAGVSKLPLSTEPFVVYKKAYSGNAFAHLKILSPVRVLTLAQNSFGLAEAPKSVLIEDFPVSGIEACAKTEVRNVSKSSGKILLTDADIVVSGGRGMKSPDNWAPIEEMAQLLGGATACSRPVSDEGWRSHDEHTGQTGKIIAPNLYIAVGISGATQHLAGVSSSKYIVAINTDKDAPIFEAAQYGIIGDAQKILPKLVEAIREVKGK
ncbi:MAG TPA: electron transfer flavoprotein subunit alpha/FixB family protein [Bacteroidales bacterium]|nr:electron transfer flavoprotein subunit alpha/FixB family protein [Bacteroidales bacterium]HSA42680.1 electron transfer flavoprotein subunit alpha/FixB family protein [Bacteroidales bacterium]